MLIVRRILEDEKIELINNIFNYVDINYSLKDIYEINTNNILVVTSILELKVNLNLMINNAKNAKENLMVGRILDDIADKIENDIGVNLHKFSFVYNKSDVK